MPFFFFAFFPYFLLFGNPFIHEHFTQELQHALQQAQNKDTRASNRFIQAASSPEHHYHALLTNILQAHNPVYHTLSCAYPEGFLPHLAKKFPAQFKALLFQKSADPFGILCAQKGAWGPFLQATKCLHWLGVSEKKKAKHLFFQKDTQGNTVLHAAAEHAQIEFITLFAKTFPSSLVKDLAFSFNQAGKTVDKILAEKYPMDTLQAFLDQLTCLHISFAAQEKLLLKKPPSSLEKKEPYNLLQILTARGKRDFILAFQALHPRTFKRLAFQTIHQEASLGRIAAEKSHLETLKSIIESLLRLEVPLSVLEKKFLLPKDLQGNSLLHQAALYEHPEFLEGFASAFPTVFQILVGHQNSQGYSVAALAIQKGSLPLLKALLGAVLLYTPKTHVEETLLGPGISKEPLLCISVLKYETAFFDLLQNTFPITFKKSTAHASHN